jgi:hypothetical protein
MKKSHFLCLILGLVLMFLGPTGGSFTAMLRMRRAAEIAGDRDLGRADLVAHEIGEAVHRMTIGMAVGIIGLGVAVSAIVLYFVARRVRRRRAAGAPPFDFPPPRC